MDVERIKRLLFKEFERIITNIAINIEYQLKSINFSRKIDPKCIPIIENYGSYIIVEGDVIEENGLYYAVSCGQKLLLGTRKPIEIKKKNNLSIVYFDRQ